MHQLDDLVVGAVAVGGQGGVLPVRLREDVLALKAEHIRPAAHGAGDPRVDRDLGAAGHPQQLLGDARPDLRVPVRGVDRQDVQRVVLHGIEQRKGVVIIGAVVGVNDHLDLFRHCCSSLLMWVRFRADRAPRPGAGSCCASILAISVPAPQASFFHFTASDSPE